VESCSRQVEEISHHYYKVQEEESEGDQVLTNVLEQDAELVDVLEESQSPEIPCEHLDDQSPSDQDVPEVGRVILWDD
jgi:hypothetical protein